MMHVITQGLEKLSLFHTFIRFKHIEWEVEVYSLDKNPLYSYCSKVVLYAPQVFVINYC